MSSLFPIVRWANLTIYDTKAKWRHLKKIDPERDFVAGVCLSEAPSPLLSFCLGWSSNFLGSKSGRYRVLNFSRIWSPTGLNTPRPLPATHRPYTYCTLTQGRERGGVEPERKLKGQQFTKLGRKYQHDWLYLQSLNSDKHMPQSPFTGKFF